MASREAGALSFTRRRIAGFAVLGVLGLWIGLAAWRILEPSLLDRATRVPGFTLTSRWWVDDYAWVSDHEALLLLRAYAHRPPVTQFARLDIATGRQQKVFLDPGESKSSYDPYMPAFFSPDGRWLLHYESTPVSRFVAVTTDGTRTVKRKATWEPQVIWSRDSRSWLVMTSEHITVYNLADIPPRRINVHRSGWNILLWVDPQGRIVTYQTSNQDYRPTAFYETTLTTPSTMREMPIHLPPGTLIKDAQLSPKGDRVVWLLSIPQPGWWKRMQGRLVIGSRGPVKQTDTEGIWVSRPDGGEMREIGRVQATVNPPGMRAVKWTPDGKRLCFLYQYGMYTVPVE